MTKKFALILSLVLFAAVPALANQYWHASGIVVNPAAAQVIVDTGAMAASGGTFRRVNAFVCSSVAAVFNLQVRNGANTASTFEQIIAVPASACSPIFYMPDYDAFPMEDNGRVRIIMQAAVTGSVSVSLWHTP
jgi:hypothetical protein